MESVWLEVWLVVRKKELVGCKREGFGLVGCWRRNWLVGWCVGKVRWFLEGWFNWLR